MQTCRMLLLNTSMSTAVLSRYRYAWRGQDEAFNNYCKHASWESVGHADHRCCSLRSAA